MGFKAIIGQNMAKKILQSHLEEGMIYHTYLFYGLKGVGKYTTARAFAQALLCQREGVDSCGECSPCRRFQGDNHPDYLEIKPVDGTINLDGMLEMRRSLSYRPYEGKYRVILIRDADRLTSAAANSILKSLEEPPSYMVIILITNNKGSILPTIESRALPIAFTPLADGLLKEYMASTINDEVRLQVVVSLAGGSLGLAQTLAKDEDLFAKRVELLNRLISLAKDSFFGVFELRRWIEDNWATNYELFFYILQLWYNDLIKTRLKLVDCIVNKDFAGSLQELALEWDLADMQKIIPAIEETRNQFLRNVNQQLALEVLLLKISSWRK